MMQYIAIPRINALGHTGPEQAPQLLLKKISHQTIQVENQDIKADQEKIKRDSLQYMTLQETPFFIGGDHSITYPLAMNFYKIHKQNACLIIFDAHADAMPSMPEPTHEEIIEALVKKGFPKEQIILIGLRKIEPEEENFLQKRNITYFAPEEPEAKIIQKIKEVSKDKNIYLSIDIDVLDPKIAPGVNYPEENGLTTEQLSYIIAEIFKTKRVKAIDLVEVVPQKDTNNKTIRIAQELIEFIEDQS